MLVHVFQSKETGRYLATNLNGSIETASKPEHGIYWKVDDKKQEMYFRKFIRTNKKKIEHFRLMHVITQFEEVSI